MMHFLVQTGYPLGFLPTSSHVRITASIGFLPSCLWPMALFARLCSFLCLRENVYALKKTWELQPFDPRKLRIMEHLCIGLRLPAIHPPGGIHIGWSLAVIHWWEGGSSPDTHESTFCLQRNVPPRVCCKQSSVVAAG